MNSKLSFLLTILFSIGLISCEKDFLETKPKTSIEEKEAFSSSGKILAQVNGLYGKLQNQNFYGGRMIVFNEQRADEFGQNDGNAATGSAVWNQNVASTNEYINDVWAAGYSAINAVNILIDNLSNTTVISGDLAKQYIAEAKFVRAVAYFNLCQIYARPYNQNPASLGLPLRLTPIRTAGQSDLARSTVAEVYQQIIMDLDEAEIDLPDSYSSAALNSSRAHKATAVAFKTRVYLHQNQFGKIIDEASKLVPPSPPFEYQSGSVAHKLESNFLNVFSGSYTGVESIFSIPFLNSSTETPSAQYSLAFSYLGQPILFLAEKSIVEHPALSDVKDSRSQLITTNAAKLRVLRKFAITTAPFRDYVPVIRYSEVLLNYAEAAAQSGDLGLAVNLLKAVRNRSNPDHVFDSSEIATREQILDLIITERRIEFLGEGLRLLDLQRRVLPLPAKKGNIGTAPEVLPTAANYIWPIPSGELSTNRLCLPN